MDQYSNTNKADLRLERLERQVDQVSKNVTELTKTIHDGFTELSTAITKLALAALSKQDGFKGGDVLKLLAGIGMFTYGIIYGLEKFGLLTKILN